MTLIFDRFARAHSELLKAMKMQNRPSLLDWLLGGNYTLLERLGTRVQASNLEQAWSFEATF